MYLVKPQPGMRVRHPDHKFVLTEKGCEIDRMTSYWFRREQAGEVVITEIGSQAPAIDQSMSEEA